MTKRTITVEEAASHHFAEAWAEGHSAAFTGERKRNPFPNSDPLRRAEWELGWIAGLSSLIAAEGEEEVRERRASIRLVT